MTKNVGNVERAIRVLAGLGILSLLFILEGNARWWGLVGLVPIATGALGDRPPYAMLGDQYLRQAGEPLRVVVPRARPGAAAARAYRRASSRRPVTRCPRCVSTTCWPRCPRRRCCSSGSRAGSPR